MITLLIYLHYLEKLFPSNPKEFNVIIYLDSATVLDRIHKSSTMNLRSYKDLDYDIWQLQRHLISTINFKLQWKKIKSHPTEKEKRSQGVLPSRLNAQVDDWAEQA